MAHNLKPHPTLATATARRLLHVDLTDGSTRIEPISPLDLDRFAGGEALAAAILYRLLPPGVDPFGPANILVMAPGALTGAPVPGSDRLSQAARSPQTGFIGESTLSGPIGESLARAGRSQPRTIAGPGISTNDTGTVHNQVTRSYAAQALMWDPKRLWAGPYLHMLSTLVRMCASTACPSAALPKHRRSTEDSDDLQELESEILA